MSNTYDFDKIAQSSENESPTIVMGGESYLLSYPTVEQVEKIQTLKTDEEKTNAIYSFVKPSTPETKPFKEVLQKQNIKVMQAFSDMIKKEFGVDE